MTLEVSFEEGHWWTGAWSEADHYVDNTTLYLFGGGAVAAERSSPEPGRDQ